MELIIKKGEVNIPQAVANLQELKAELAEKLEKYNGLIVTDDAIKEAKEDKANLNKLKKAIEDQRIEAKKQILALYEPLERECKEVVALIDTPIKSIDEQIKAFEEREKNAKRDALLEHYNAAAGGLDFIKFEQIINPKWANKSESLAKLKKEIDEKLAGIRADYEELRSYYQATQFWAAIEMQYKQTTDKAAAMAYAVQLQKRQEEQERAAEEEARRRQEEIERNRQESEKMAAQSYEAPASPRTDASESNIITPPTPTEAHSEPAGAPNEPELTGTFEVTTTKAKLIQLRDYMRANNIKFRVSL